MKYIQQAFDTNWIAPLGPNVDEFEKETAQYVGVGYAAALSSGTAAIHLALKSLGVEQGDIVFCSSLTFSASANPIVYLGATPVFIDSEAETWNMSPASLEKAYKKYPNPKALIAVNLYGQPCDFDSILDITKKHGTPIIEDAAESLGAIYKGRQTGTFGDIGVFSFNGNKIITTSGGGMLVSNNEQVVEKTRFWATQARDSSPWYQHSEIGYNYRMSNVCAGIGRGQLEVLDERIDKKRYIYGCYNNAFSAIPQITMAPLAAHSESSCWLSCITLDEGIEPLVLIDALEKQNIESRPVWKPMHLQPVFANCDFVSESESGSVAEDIFNKGVCLPSDTKMTDAEIERVTSVIAAFVGK